MTIIRAPRAQSNFYILDKNISEDSRLSWAARGMLIFLLGKPDNWSVSIAHLVSETQGSRKASGRDAVYALINELVEAGYIYRGRIRGEDGRFSHGHMMVRETPEYDGCCPHPENPDTGFPDEANPTLISTESLTTTEEEQVPASPNPEKPKRTKQELTFTEYRQQLQTQGEKFLSENDPLFDWTDVVGLPESYIGIAWHAFKDKYATNQKKQKDWRAVFRRAVKEDWLKLWAIGRDGNYYLTTNGKTAERERDANRATA